MIEAKKIAFVTSYGGTLCSRNAGGLLAWEEKFGHIKPDIVVAYSGTVGNVVYHLAGQAHLGHKIWTGPIASTKFISHDPVSGEDPPEPLPEKPINIDYLVDGIFKEQFPVDIDAFRRSKTRVFIAVKHMASGKTRYITNEELAEGRLDLYTVMKAAKALPGVPPVEIDGELYGDAAGPLSLRSGIKLAFEEGADSVVVFDNRPEWEKGSFREKLKRSPLYPRIAYIASEDYPAKLNGEEFIESPLTHDSAKIEALFNAGHRAVWQHRFLEKLFSDSVTTSHRTAA